MEEENNNGMKFQVLGLAILIIGVLAYNLWASKFSDKLRTNHILVCGNIIGMYTGKGSNVVYEFFLDSNRYEFNKSCPNKTYDNYKMGIKRILLVVEKEHPDNNVILDKSEDYQKFDIKDEDTLNLKCQTGLLMSGSGS